MASKEVYIFDALPSIPPSTPEMIKAATHTVCGNAENVDEAIMFLSMLGLLEGVTS